MARKSLLSAETTNPEKRMAFMELNQTIDGLKFADMLRAGAAELRANVNEINDLNVFPIPDGDTGSNMLRTLMGGVEAINSGSCDIALVSRSAANGMLFAARGNSGVILSQFFDGIATGLQGEPEASTEKLSHAFRCGVHTAYESVLKPTEGTILTVARCAAENAEIKRADSIASYMATYINEAKKTLERTPEMLPVLKTAGVIDSGGAGLVRILEGMYKALCGEMAPLYDMPHYESENNELDIDKFTEDSILTYGYCTEVLLRLQKCKTDVENFDIGIITDYLKTIGDSVVAFKTGSIVKIHVHTMTPDIVLGFCRKYGEFLKLKIENMSLQHNNTVEMKNETEAKSTAERKKYGVVAVCSGMGIKEMFRERGVDVIVDGGQSMNPSAEDFIRAFSQVEAEHIFVLPNNGNVIMAAEQAARIYKNSDIRVLTSKTVGEGYAALSMINPDEASVEMLTENLNNAMSGVVTAEISHCIRDAEMCGIELHVGDYIGVCGKELLTVSERRLETAIKTLEALGMSSYDICLIIRGKDADADEAEQLAEHVRAAYRGKEVYTVDGMQDIYDYIIILQ